MGLVKSLFALFLLTCAFTFAQRPPRMMPPPPPPEERQLPPPSQRMPQAEKQIKEHEPVKEEAYE